MQLGGTARSWGGKDQMGKARRQMVKLCTDFWRGRGAFGWKVETSREGVQRQAHRDKIPIIPDQSRFSRLRRDLMGVIDEMRRRMLVGMALDWGEHCVVDSLPIPMVQFHLAPQSRVYLAAWGADYGPVPSKKKMIFGFSCMCLSRWVASLSTSS